MRLWLDPDKIAARGLTAGDVVRAVREQNIQVSAGQLGAEPMANGSQFLTPINARGRLETTEEFGNIVLKSGEGGEIVRLADVARIELAAGDYTMRARLDGKNAAAIGIFQAPGANALQIRDEVIARMDEAAKRFPPGIEYKSIYDTTIFVRDSIKSVITTLLEATLLVVLVVILFLQTWRASIIPLIAVPVSVIGTFAALYLLGFSINTLTLFGLVLAIGIVVDDAIVVVENVERHIEEGATPLEAAHLAMKEVSGPIIAIALVLCAVFVPMAFLSGVTGQFYKQFAVTIAISTVISAINSLTLSPALAARLLKPHGAPKDVGIAADRSPVRLGVPPVQPLLQQERAALRARRVEGAGSARRGVRDLCGAVAGDRADVPGRAARLHPGAGQGLPHRRRQDARRRIDRAHGRGAEEDRRHGDADRGYAERRRLPRPQPAAVHQHAQLRRDLLQPQAVRRAHTLGLGDQRRAQRRSSPASRRASRSR